MLIKLTGDSSWDLFINSMNEDLTNLAKTINYGFDDLFESLNIW
jgi:hypothetical protein